ncbi:DUF4294 domain-containing protein [Alistipes sp. OttesenSCG-928-L06]|nr:DUF4294 domain-containing protein [Alistipes sp. OttesenSCG-928-L06]
MKNWSYIGLLLLLLCCGNGAARAQSGRTVHGGPPTLDNALEYRVRTLRYLDFEVGEQGDTLFNYRMNPVPVYSNILIDRDKHRRLIRNVKIVYPIAKYANDKLREMESQMDGMQNKREQERYVKEVERQLKEQYTPVIKRMSFSQGKVLIKLIDRETGHTSYELVQDLRGKFSAFFWQNLGRLFGMNLKDGYDPEGDDKLIEQIITYYEAGLL